MHTKPEIWAVRDGKLGTVHKNRAGDLVDFRPVVRAAWGPQNLSLENNIYVTLYSWYGTTIYRCDSGSNPGTKLEFGPWIHTDNRHKHRTRTVVVHGSLHGVSFTYTEQTSDECREAPIKEDLPSRQDVLNRLEANPLSGLNYRLISRLFRHGYARKSAARRDIINRWKSLGVVPANFILYGIGEEWMHDLVVETFYKYRSRKAAEYKLNASK
jgi:hypothetical protein